MGLAQEIDLHNMNFRKEQARFARDFVSDALEKENLGLDATFDQQMVFSVGRFDAELMASGNGYIDATYTRSEIGRVWNYYQFIDMVYNEYINRIKAFEYKGKDELSNLQAEFEQSKKQEYVSLGESTMISLDAIMQYDQAVVQAKSQQKIEKKSYTHVRDISLTADTTNMKLRALGRQKGFDLEAVYKSFEDTRLKIASLERGKSKKLVESHKKVKTFFNDFLECLDECIACMTDLGIVKLPRVSALEEIELIDKNMLGGIFYKMLAADKTIIPQNTASSEIEFYPMPMIVLVPVTGYVYAGQMLSVEKYRQNVIFFPMRCLEDPVSAITRELLKLKRKIDPKREVLAREAYMLFIRHENLMGGSYDIMYEKFIRFILGESETIKGFTNDERRIIGGHFIPHYTSNFFITPEMRPTISLMEVGNKKARAIFNKAIIENQKDPFITGLLHADRARQYNDMIKEIDDPSAKYVKSLHTNRDAAKRLFTKAYKQGKYPRFALFNLAVLMSNIKPENKAKIVSELETASKLFAKSSANETMDLWSYKAEKLRHKCFDDITEFVKSQQPVQPEPEEESKEKENENSFLSWIKTGLKKG